MPSQYGTRGAGVGVDVPPDASGNVVQSSEPTAWASTKKKSHGLLRVPVHPEGQGRAAGRPAA